MSKDITVKQEWSLMWIPGVAIYWKMSPMMYMLQEKASGDWIIAEDAFGQNVWMRQTSE